MQTMGHDRERNVLSPDAGGNSAHPVNRRKSWQTTAPRTYVQNSRSPKLGLACDEPMTVNLSKAQGRTRLTVLASLFVIATNR